MPLKKNKLSDLQALQYAVISLLAHHRIADLRKLHSDTLDPRFEAVDRLLADVRDPDEQPECLEPGDSDRVANLTRCNDQQREHLEALQRQNQKQLEELTTWKTERDRLWFAARDLLGFLCYARKQNMPQSIINSTLMHDLPIMITGSAHYSAEGTPRSHGYAKHIDL